MPLSTQCGNITEAITAFFVHKIPLPKANREMLPLGTVSVRRIVVYSQRTIFNPVYSFILCKNTFRKWPTHFEPDQKFKRVSCYLILFGMLGSAEVAYPITIVFSVNILQNRVSRGKIKIKRTK